MNEIPGPASSAVPLPIELERIRPAPGSIRADEEIRALLASVCGERELPGESADTLLARAVWSRLTEPGDAIAGLLIMKLGVLDALRLVEQASSARPIAQALFAADSSVDPPPSQQLTAALKRWRPRIDRAASIGDLQTALRMGIQLVTPESQFWPYRLDSLSTHAPHALWVRGNPLLLGCTIAGQPAPALAVVGARACTGYGSHVTAELTGEACAAGVTIVSGAAYGVDAIAHRTALATEAATVAVLAGGADRPYPVAHTQLLDRIASQGAICSELVPGAAPTRWRFLQRNRIIAALADAVLVTEAGVRSGTLNTAGHAAEIGRVIGAVPGPITSAASAGCHRLVREYGATLVTSGADVLELIGVQAEGGALGAEDTALDDDRPTSLHTRLLDALPLRGARSPNEAAIKAGVSVEEAQGAFAELELLGYIERIEHPKTGMLQWKLLRRS